MYYYKIAHFVNKIGKNKMFFYFHYLNCNAFDIYLQNDGI